MNPRVIPKKSQKGRWKGMDEDISDDQVGFLVCHNPWPLPGASGQSRWATIVLQQDITRGRGLVDSLFQGASGQSGTQNAILSSEDYLSNAARTLNNIEDGFYISPAFLDKITVHIAKNFLELPKIKVPLILGASFLTF